MSKLAGQEEDYPITDIRYNPVEIGRTGTEQSSNRISGQRTLFRKRAKIYAKHPD